jgi:hypothetical protein
MNPADLINSPAFAGGQSTSSGDRPKVSWGDVARTIILPADTPFAARIKKATYTKPKKEVNDDGEATYPYIAFQIVITEEGEFLGENIFDNFTMKPGKMFMLRKLAEKGGLDLDAMAEQDFDEKVYEGLEVKFTFSVQEGKDGYPPRNRVSGIFALDEI